jgi:NADPH:quinone reductase-like Zn-dependent oxidoreductase
VKQVIKREGIDNIGISDAPVPSLGSRQVLVRNKRTLISPGTEIGSRYLPSEANSREDGGFGYSSAGVIEAVGDQVTEYQIGERVAVHAPHAELVVWGSDVG